MSETEKMQFSTKCIHIYLVAKATKNANLCKFLFSQSDVSCPTQMYSDKSRYISLWKQQLEFDIIFIVTNITWMWKPIDVKKFI